MRARVVDFPLTVSGNYAYIYIYIYMITGYHTTSNVLDSDARSEPTTTTPYRSFQSPRRTSGKHNSSPELMYLAATASLRHDFLEKCDRREGHLNRELLKCAPRRTSARCASARPARLSDSCSKFWKKKRDKTIRLFLFRYCIRSFLL